MQKKIYEGLGRGENPEGGVGQGKIGRKSTDYQTKSLLMYFG